MPYDFSAPRYSYHQVTCNGEVCVTLGQIVLTNSNCKNCTKKRMSHNSSQLSGFGHVEFEPAIDFVSTLVSAFVTWPGNEVTCRGFLGSVSLSEE